MEQKPEIKEFNVDNIPGRLYSIPNRDGDFLLEEHAKSTQDGSCYHKIDKEGNVYFINEAGIQRSINQFQSYLEPIWDLEFGDNVRTFDNDNQSKITVEGFIIKKLAKVNKDTGKLINKGKILLVKDKKGIFYELGGEKEIAEVKKTDNTEKGKQAEIERSIFKENTTPILGDRIYLKEKEGDAFFKEAKDERNGFYVLFNFSGNRASYRFCGNVGRAMANYDAVLSEVFNDKKTLTFKATDIINLKDGIVELDSNGKWKIITPAEIAFVIGDKVSGLKKLNDAIIEHINDKYEDKISELEKNINKVQKETNNPVPTIEEKPKDDQLEKQKKIDEIYSEIMEMINRNTESLLREQKLEEELAQLIASDTKKEVVDEPTKKIEAKPFSFNIEFIKNKIQEIIANNEGIKEIEGFSIIPGPNNEFILNVKKITAEFKFLFTFTTDITIKNAHIINFGDGIKLNNNYEITATNYEKKVKDKMAKNIDKISDAIKEIIEKEVGKKVEKIWIENGELKAL